VVEWRPGEGGAWQEVVEGSKAVINLAGEPIEALRWTKRKKERILASRIKATRAIVEAIAAAKEKPSVLISVSGVNYYGPHEDEFLTESDPPGNDFLASVAVAWEEEAKRAEGLGLRVVVLRLGVVLGQGGGVLSKLMLPFKFFVGGRFGRGQQWSSWIHLEDAVGFMRFALEDERVRGPINATAPAPQRNKDFAKALGRVLSRPAWLPVPAFLMRLLLGEMAEILLTGQRVVPDKAEHLGYQFKYPTLEGALRNILGQQR
jgi:uncharacterized protein (TIGR01777 family)